MKDIPARILSRVQKPARYGGGEYGRTVKDPQDVTLRIALCFPDVYEIGMSNLGCRILYGAANAVPRYWCERVFAPWGDMAAEMRGNSIPLYALESGDRVRGFDIVAFSLGYEMAYTTVLDMLDLAGIPPRASERESLTPLVIAGGTCCYNPEPMSDFIDLFIIGEGEEVNLEVYAALEDAKARGLTKSEFLRAAVKIPGVYVPSLYGITYNDDGTVAAIVPREGAPLPVRKRVVSDFESSYFPADAPVPSTEIVHDRVSLELARGCIRGCRFCQAGFAYRPTRERSVKTLVSQGITALSHSGYDEISLLSLSASDYTRIGELCGGLLEYCEGRGISLSLPSLRADSFTPELMGFAKRVRKSGLTFAPEAGSKRLRDIINKNVAEDDIMTACRLAFGGGWNGVKLYFMLGLPDETDEDVLEIAALARKIAGVWRESAGDKRRGVRITVSTSHFVPKPHTPFQWEPQIAPDEYSRRVALLREALRGGGKMITYNWHSPDTSFIEAVLSRGDRRLGRVIERVFHSGGRLEAWDENFSLERWENAFRECGLDPDFYAARRACGDDEILPWSVVSTGVSVNFLRRERARAGEGLTTPDCRAECSLCGVCHD